MKPTGTRRSDISEMWAGKRVVKIQHDQTVYETQTHFEVWEGQTRIARYAWKNVSKVCSHASLIL